MKSIILMVVTMVLAGVMADAAPKAKRASAQPVAKATPSKLSRNLSFTGSSVDGKYHSAGESVAQVESEKSLNMLMGIRKNFRDRLADEQARLAAGEGTKQ
jgi:hypothetical protein